MTVDLQSEDTRARAARLRRAERYRIRDLTSGFSSFDRIQLCGKFRVSAEAGVGVWLRGDTAHFSNLQTCGSVHACPVCAPKIRQRRAEEISTAVNRHLETGGGAEFVTLTLPHNFGDRLAPLLDAVARSFRSVLSGRGFVADREAFGIVGTIRALEVNHGPNGWHPHLHVLVFTSRPLSVRARAALRRSLFGRWERSVVRAGYERPLLGPGCKVVAVRDGDGIGAYTSKVVGLELTRHDLKGARRKAGGYRSAFAIAADLLAFGDTDDLALWSEYETATHGRQALTWSKGLKARFAIGLQTDDEIAAEEIGGTQVAIIGQATWCAIIRRRLRAQVLTIAQDHGADGLAEWLARLEDELYATV